MNKVLLLAINARYTHSNLAVRYLRNFTCDLDYKIKIKELSINQPFWKILDTIYNEDPDVVAISVYIWNSKIVKSILTEIKKILKNVKIVLGGPEVSYNPNSWLESFSAIDYIVSGAGEAAFRYLLKNNLNLTEQIIRRANPKLNQIPFPYINKDLNELEHKYIYYEASRGCAFKCSYCISSRFEQKLELRSFEKVKTELNFLIAHKPKIIKFVDRTFNIKQFSHDIWEFLIKKEGDTKFHFEIHPQLLTEKDFNILKKCPPDRFQFEIGIQTTNRRSIKAINRKQKWEKIASLIKRLISLKNIHIHLDFIAGLPWEDMESTKRSINDIYQLKPDNFQLGFLKVLPGTEMMQKQNEYELQFLQDAPYQVLQNKWLSYSELQKIRKIEQMINTFYNSGKYSTFIEELEQEFGTPFEMYGALSEFENSTFVKNKKNWQKNSKDLIAFIKVNFSQKVDFFLDCLRWDWCKIASAHYYPDHLQDPILTKAKKMGYPYVKALIKADEIEISKNRIKLTHLKKAIFFQPISKSFEEKYLSQNEIAVFFQINSKRYCYKFDLKDSQKQ